MSMPGIVDPAVVSSEITLLGFMLGLPVIALLIGRIRWMFVLGVVLVVVPRAFMVMEIPPITPTASAGWVVGGSLFYLVLLIRNRAQIFPYFFILGFAGDQLLRAGGNTLDPTFSTTFEQTAIIVAVVAIILSIINVIQSRPSSDEKNTSGISPQQGILSLWSGVALGALLFLELSLLALPNAVAGRADADYTTFVPLVLLATVLPLVPWVRQQARNFLGSFDNNVRGWVWLVLTVLFIILGTRIQGIPILNLGEFPFGALMLVIAQFAVSLVWWWLIRPRGEGERFFAGIWLVLTMLFFALFVVFDLFTYEYAFVRDFAPPFDSLNSVIPPLLRGFRGLGLGVLLLATFFATLPIIQTTRRIPWSGKRLTQSLSSLLLVALISIGGAYLARPPQIQPLVGESQIRVGTYNIHAGYNEFFDYNLEAIANTIQQSGARVILIQEIEKGRLTSFGVDQPLWLARRLGMDVRFYATNEGLQGLAVLSRVPIVFDDGVLLTSDGQQTGLQRVQIQPDDNAVNIYNTWLGVLLQGSNIAEQEDEQRRQLREIFAVIDTHVANDYGDQLGRTLLGGTFNNIPDNPLIREDLVQNTGFSDPFAGTNLELSATLVRTGYRARIDYIWLWEQALQPVGSLVMESQASDHRMAVVCVRIRRGEDSASC